MTNPASHHRPRARDLPFATLWRAAYLLCTATLIPLWLLLGVGRMAGVGHFILLDDDVGPTAAIPLSLLMGAGMSLFFGTLLSIGALILVTIRRIASR